MRAIFSIFILFIFNYHQLGNTESRLTSIKDTVAKLIEGVRSDIPEPITITKYHVDMPENDYIKGSIDVSDFNLSGIKAFNMVFAYLLLIPKSFVLTLDQIDLSTKYLSDLKLLNTDLLSIFGQGDVTMSFTNITMTAKVVLANYSIGSTTVHLDDAQFKFSGLLDDETFSTEITDFLNNNVVTLFNQYSDVIASTVEHTVNTLISGLLNTTSADAFQIEDTNGYNDFEITEDILQALIERIHSLLKWH